MKNRNHAPTSTGGERGIALVLTMFLTMAISVLSASLMFLAQTETYSTMNYRTMSQARYGAESGIHAAANFLLNTYPPIQPGTGTDPLAAYNMTVSPVTWNNQPVVLSAIPGVASNYPIAATQTAFSAASQGTLVAGRTNVGYAAAATLMSMQAVGSSIVQTWQLTSNGTVPGPRVATVEVTSSLESQVVAGVGYATFATGQGCGSITLSGNAETDSYDSSLYSGAGAITAANGGLANSGGNVGTNGNLKESGTATINGTLSTPRTGTGSCANGGGGVANSALTQSGGSSVTGGLVQLPAVVVLPTPPYPNPMPPTTNLSLNGGSTCLSIALAIAPATCSGPAGNLTITPSLNTPVSLGNISMSGGAQLTLVGGTYNVNSMSLSGNSSLGLGAGTVKMTIAGKTAAGTDLATPMDMTGGTLSNASYDPSRFQISYPGPGEVKMSGGSSNAGVINAPNATFTISGGSDFYGSIIAKTMTNSGGTRMHYDRRLNESMFSSAGVPWLTSFSWSSF